MDYTGAPRQSHTFAAEAFADVVARGDFAAIAGAAQASLDIAATLDAIEASAAQGGALVDLPR